MAEKENKTKDKLRLSRPGKLELKKTVESGQVRQNFSHGRSKVVTVEVRKKRTFAPTQGGDMSEVQGVILEQSIDNSEQLEGVSLDKNQNLTDQEKAVRASALQQSKQIERDGVFQEEQGLPEEKLEESADVLDGQPLEDTKLDQVQSETEQNDLNALWI